MAQEVYITRVSKYLPNQPVSNEEMEGYLGEVDGKPSRARRIVLRNNGIQNRFYAVDESGKSTHSNAQLVAEAVKNLFSDSGSLSEIELLACGTTSPDQILPSHGTMVHGELTETKGVETVSYAGGCCTGMHALKHGYLSILAGETNNAVCTGSEKASSWMLGKHYGHDGNLVNELEQRPILAFEKDFLRWMLSDGAGAFFMQNKPEGELSLKVEWVQCYSLANQYEVCMYAGASKNGDGNLKAWRDHEPEAWLDQSIFALKQDVKMLDKFVVPLGMKMMAKALNKYGVSSSEIDYFLPHYSSEYFRKDVEEGMRQHGVHIPQEKWFTNLVQVGNVGAGSIYLMLEELFNSGKLQKGQKILLSVPESARFSYAYSVLTVV